MNEVEIVKWAAGAIHEPLEGVEVDEGHLFGLLAHHRLQGRFLHRVRQERPAWCGRQMLIRAWKEHARARDNLRRQAQAVREVARALGPGSLPPVVLKGLSTYALSGDERHIRWSGDIDICAGNLEALWDALVRLGYGGEIYPEWRHEYALAGRRGLWFELHRYYPVLLLPPGVAQAQLDPNANPGVWTQRFGSTQTRRIEYADLLDNSVEPSVPGMEGLLVPHPSMALLCLCAHQYRDYTEPPYARRDPIRLGELADARDLSRHPELDERRLLGLADQFGGHESLRFADDLLRTYYGNGLPCFSADSERKPRSSGFPRRWTWDACWTSPPAAHYAAELLRPSTLGAHIYGLGPNEIVAGAGELGHAYSHPARAGARDLERAVIQLVRGEMFPLDVRASWSEQVLGVEVRVRQPLATTCRIEVATQNRELHYVDLLIDGAEFSQGGDGSASLSTDAESFSVRFEMPWPLRSPPQDSAVLAMLSVTLWDHSPRAIAVVPLRITSGEPRSKAAPASSE